MHPTLPALPYRFGIAALPLRNNADVRCALAGIFGYDIQYLRENPNTPRLYQTGYKYIREVEPESRMERKWRPIPIIMAGKESDCKGLACWRAAEQVVFDGILDAHPIILEFPDLLHIIVQGTLPNGQPYLSDPSAVLGMRIPAGYPVGDFYER